MDGINRTEKRVECARIVHKMYKERFSVRGGTGGRQSRSKLLGKARPSRCSSVRSVKACAHPRPRGHPSRDHTLGNTGLASTARNRDFARASHYTRKQISLWLQGDTKSI